MAAIATFLSAGRRSAAFRAALHAIRTWPGTAEGLRRARARAGANGSEDAGGTAGPPRPPRPGPCAATPAQRRALRDLYTRANLERFHGRLPADVPIRVSRRMSRRLGHIRYHQGPDGTRQVVEIALAAPLLHPGQEDELLETLLHEMAHAEAWLLHGHAGHGAIWKRIARRVGCQPRARVPASPGERDRSGPAGL